MAESLEIVGAETLRVVKGVLAASDEAMARFASVRERLSRADEVLDHAWARVRERVEALLVQVEEESREVVASRGETAAALDHLGTGLDEVRGQAPQEFSEGRREVESLSVRVDAIPVEVTALSSNAEDANRRLDAKLSAFEKEVDEALSSAESLLRSELVGELRRVDTEVEQLTRNVQNYLEQQVLPAIMDRAQALYDQLVQTEEDVRMAVEAASSETEATTDDVLRAVEEGYDEALNELQEIADHLDQVFDGLSRHLEDAGDKHDDLKHRWHDITKALEQALKDGNESLRDLETVFSRYSFVRM